MYIQASATWCGCSHEPLFENQEEILEFRNLLKYGCSKKPLLENQGLLKLRISRKYDYDNWDFGWT